MKNSGRRRGERRYVFVSCWRRAAAGCLDALGYGILYLATLGQGRTLDPGRLRNPARILVIRLDHLGDVLFARPCLEALRGLFPRARITALVSTGGGRLLAQDSSVDEVMVWDAPWFARGASTAMQPGFWEMVRKIRSGRFDLSLDLRGDFRHHGLTFLAGVPLRLGYGVTGGGFLLHRVLNLRARTHEVERNLDWAKFLGAVRIPDRYAPLALTAEEIQTGRRVWKSRGLRVAVHPGAGDPRKCWPQEVFSRVVDGLARRGAEIGLVGTAEESGAAEALARGGGPRACSLAGKTSLRGLAALLGEADLMIGHDSGPAHLALTQGVPTIMLWSETNEPEEWGPWGAGSRARVIRRSDPDRMVSEILSAAGEFLSRGKRRK